MILEPYLPACADAKWLRLPACDDVKWFRLGRTLPSCRHFVILEKRSIVRPWCKIHC